MKGHLGHSISNHPKEENIVVQEGVRRKVRVFVGDSVVRKTDRAMVNVSTHIKP